MNIQKCELNYLLFKKKLSNTEALGHPTFFLYFLPHRLLYIRQRTNKIVIMVRNNNNLLTQELNIKIPFIDKSIKTHTCLVENT